MIFELNLERDEGAKELSRDDAAQGLILDVSREL